MANNYWFKMPYYHVIIGLKGRPHRGIFEKDLTRKELAEKIVAPYSKGEAFRCGDVIVNQGDISCLKITRSEQKISVPTYYVSPETYFADHWEAISQKEDVTGKFVKKSPQRRKEVIKEGTPISKNVFIVHGSDHKPMKELKAMLGEFGLTPIVLHELPSGSRTIVEKLEKHSAVGYAFVVLTPDDAGYCQREYPHFPRRKESDFVPLAELRLYPLESQSGLTYEIFHYHLKERARQNVILEFGYFIGKLGRDRVCCLHKGGIELPSDMHGIVYIPFKESVNEIRDKIVEELEAAGYEIKI